MKKEVKNLLSVFLLFACFGLVQVQAKQHNPRHHNPKVMVGGYYNYNHPPIRHIHHAPPPVIAPIYHRPIAYDMYYDYRYFGSYQPYYSPSFGASIRFSL